jgi:hypothetical protein
VGNDLLYTLASMGFQCSFVELMSVNGMNMFASNIRGLKNLKKKESCLNIFQNTYVDKLEIFPCYALALLTSHVIDIVRRALLSTLSVVTSCFVTLSLISYAIANIIYHY